MPDPAKWPANPHHHHNVYSPWPPPPASAPAMVVWVLQGNRRPKPVLAKVVGKNKAWVQTVEGERFQLFTTAFFTELAAWCRWQGQLDYIRKTAHKAPPMYQGRALQLEFGADNPRGARAEVHIYLQTPQYLQWRERYKLRHVPITSTRPRHAV